MVVHLALAGQDDQGRTVLRELGQHLLRRARRGLGWVLRVRGVLGDASDEVAAAVDRELAGHAGRIAWAAVGASHAAGIGVRAGDDPIERIDDRVDDGRLARAGRAVDQEQARRRQLVEVDHLPISEGPDPGDG